MSDGKKADTESAIARFLMNAVPEVSVPSLEAVRYTNVFAASPIDPMPTAIARKVSIVRSPDSKISGSSVVEKL